MDSSDNGQLKRIIDTNSQTSVADIYQSIEQLSLPEKAVLAQHLPNTNELSVVVNSGAAVDAASKPMDRVQLGIR